MSYNNKSKNNRAAIEQKEKLARDGAKLAQLWKGLDGNGEDDEIEYSQQSRYEVPPPEPRDQSKYNPRKIVDIETFIKHPHFLNLNPYPWQILVLKLFYAGSEGNSILELNDAKKEEESGCDKCVWKYILEDEKKAHEEILKGNNPHTILNPSNSKCLKCIRCPLNVKKERLEYEIENAPEIDKENALREILSSENEDLFQSEIDLIEEIPDEAVKLQIMNKLKNKFQELVLIIGRRGTKSFLTVAIALYETYKLLSMYHPQKQLKLPDLQEIHIINVAKNENQARDSIFNPMKSLALASPFFQKHIGEPLALELKFLTSYDIQENERRAAKGIALLEGTIILLSGSSSASGLVGKTCWAIILDELAAMAGDNPNSGLDKKLYSDLKPSISTFGGDGKIICLSNPKGPFGKLFELYNTRLEIKNTLVLKLPTWNINANVDKLWLEEERKKDPIEYNMQYGAEFGTNSEDPFLSAEDVDYAFSSSQRVRRLEERENYFEYFCHVDPANRSDYYAVVVAHSVQTMNKDFEGNYIKHFFIDHIHYWAPIQLKHPVRSEVVEEYILGLHQRFRFKQVSFDQWHSSEIVDSLVQKGVPAVIRVFNKEYKDKIYINLLDIFRNRRLEFYRMSGGKVVDKNNQIIQINEIPEAKDQFTFLQKKWRNGRQIIEALTGYKDDICDASAAVLYECDNYNTQHPQRPKPRLVYTGRR